MFTCVLFSTWFMLLTVFFLPAVSERPGELLWNEGGLRVDSSTGHLWVCEQVSSNFLRGPACENDRIIKQWRQDDPFSVVRRKGFGDAISDPPVSHLGEAPTHSASITSAWLQTRCTNLNINTCLSLSEWALTQKKIPFLWKVPGHFLAMTD